MDITLAKTFLAIIDAGSFKDAAGRLFVTQSTVSLRVKSLEEALGRKLFERSKTGITLTPAGLQFQRHATALLRVWNHARFDVAIADAHSDHLAIGGQTSLWDRFLIPWVAWLRRAHKELAVTAMMGTSDVLMERLGEGTLDLAVVYRAHARPGLCIEHLLNEELVLVSSTGEKIDGPDENYVFVNWGPEFGADHAEAYPELNHSGLKFDLGAVAISYFLDSPASGYFPLRVAKPYLEDGRLQIAKRARRFVYPVYAAYPEDRDESAYKPILEGLRSHAEKI